MNIIVINSIDEIEQVGLDYAHASKPEKHISINKNNDGTFYIHGYVSGQMPSAITASGNYIKEWKTFAGAKRSLKQFAKTGAWGMSHWHIK